MSKKDGVTGRYIGSGSGCVVRYVWMRGNRFVVRGGQDRTGEETESQLRRFAPSENKKEKKGAQSPKEGGGKHKEHGEKRMFSLGESPSREVQRVFKGVDVIDHRWPRGR